MDRPIPFITRVQLRDFKSIAQCDVRLGPFTVVVGPNASGKSNFLSSFKFLSRAVGTSVYDALENFGGLDAILRRGPKQATSLSIDIEATVRWGPDPSQWPHAIYGFEIGRPPGYGIRTFEVLRESCEIHLGDRKWGFRVERGQVIDDDMTNAAPSIPPDTLYLRIAARNTTYGPLFEGLSSMLFYDEFYRVDVESSPEPIGEAILGAHGENLSHVLASLATARPDLIERINNYLNAISPRIRGVETLTFGNSRVVVFRQQVGRDGDEIEFRPAAVSYGTTHATCVLAALFQLPVVNGLVPLITIEEPGISLHPAAAGVLFDALTEASEHVQIIVTNHSPELLDRDDVGLAVIVVARMDSGESRIGAIDQVGKETVKDNLYTVGELMRGDQIFPDLGKSTDNDHKDSRG